MFMSKSALSGCVAFLIFLLCLLPNYEFKADNIPSIENEIVGPYVQIICEAGNCGAGIIIKHGDSLKVLTCEHVVNHEVPLKLRKVRGNEEKVVDTTIEYMNSELDLAILSVTEFNQYTTLINNSPNIGETCYVIGSPGGLHACLDRGIFNSVEFPVSGEKYPFYLTNAFGWYGSSGGGAFVLRDGHYKLAGTVCRMLISIPRGPLYVTNIEQIRSFLNEYSRVLREQSSDN